MFQSLVTAFVGVVGIGGTLAATYIAGRWGLKQRKAEIYFRQKADAYAALFKAVHEVIFASRDETVYIGYLTAFERTKMFASCEVRRILEGDKKPGPDTLSNAIQLLRRSADEKEELSTRVHLVHEVMAVVECVSG